MRNLTRPEKDAMHVDFVEELSARLQEILDEADPLIQHLTAQNPCSDPIVIRAAADVIREQYRSGRWAEVPPSTRPVKWPSDLKEPV